MSIIDQQKELESFSDQMLVGEAQRPTGRYPQFLVITEMQRRKDLRTRAQAQQYEQQPSVAEKLTAETGSLGGRGIPAADPSAGAMAPNGMMNQGIAKFAGGGMVEGYQRGGPGPDPPITWWGKLLRGDYGLPEMADWEAMVAATDPMARTQPRDPVISRSAAAQQRPSQPAPVPLDPAQSYLGRQQAGTLPPSMTQEKPRGPEPYLGLERGSLSERAAIERAGIEDAIRGMRGSQEGLREQADDYMASAEQFDEEQQALMAELAQTYRDAISTGPTGAERELAALRRDPESMRREKIAMAAAGIGSLIAGATDPGAIGRGMSDLTRDILARGQDMRTEDIALAQQIGALEQARKDRDIDLRAQAIAAQGESLRTSRALASEAWTIEQGLHNNMMEIEKLAMQGRLDKASALDAAEQFQYSMELMMQKERMTSGINFGTISSLVNGLTRAMEQIETYGYGEDMDITETKRKLIQTLGQLLNMAGQGMNYRMGISPGGFEGGMPTPEGDAGGVSFTPG